MPKCCSRCSKSSSSSRSSSKASRSDKVCINACVKDPSSHTRCSQTSQRGKRSSSGSTYSKGSECVPVDSSLLNHPQHRGDVYNVANARAYIGNEARPVRVIKWIRSRHGSDSFDHMKVVIETGWTATDVVERFLKKANVRGWDIQIVQPELMRCEKKAGSQKTDLLVLSEPYIRGYTDFSSVLRQRCPPKSPEKGLLNALGHFRYKWSNGHMVLTDFRGRVDRTKKRIVLTSPNILPSKEAEFGGSDEGCKGIRYFFKRHTCNALCKEMPKQEQEKSSNIKPSNPRTHQPKVFFHLL